jgi:hypothetical protein
MHFISSSLRVVKLAENSSHFMLQGKFRQIDEVVDDPKLLAMLGNESLDLNGNAVSAETVLAMLEPLPINQWIDLSVVERVG